MAYNINIIPTKSVVYIQVGNAETEGYTMVVGVGATMVIYSAVSAIAEQILDVSS